MASDNLGQPQARSSFRYEYRDGSEWCINGQLHRMDGPAVEYADGSREWWVNDQPLSFNQWLDAVARTLEERMDLTLRWT